MSASQPSWQQHSSGLLPAPSPRLKLFEMAQAATLTKTVIATSAAAPGSVRIPAKFHGAIVLAKPETPEPVLPPAGSTADAQYMRYVSQWRGRHPHHGDQQPSTDQQQQQNRIGGDAAAHGAHRSSSSTRDRQHPYVPSASHLQQQQQQQQQHTKGATAGTDGHEAEEPIYHHAELVPVPKQHTLEKVLSSDLRSHLKMSDRRVAFCRRGGKFDDAAFEPLAHQSEFTRHLSGEYQRDLVEKQRERSAMTSSVASSCAGGSGSAAQPERSRFVDYALPRGGSGSAAQPERSRFVDYALPRGGSARGYAGGGGGGKKPPHPPLLLLGPPSGRAPPSGGRVGGCYYTGDPAASAAVSGSSSPRARLHSTPRAVGSAGSASSRTSIAVVVIPDAQRGGGAADADGEEGGSAGGSTHDRPAPAMLALLPNTSLLASHKDDAPAESRQQRGEEVDGGAVPGDRPDLRRTSSGEPHAANLDQTSAASCPADRVASGGRVRKPSLQPGNSSAGGSGGPYVVATSRPHTAGSVASMGQASLAQTTVSLSVSASSVSPRRDYGVPRSVTLPPPWICMIQQHEVTDVFLSTASASTAAHSGGRKGGGGRAASASASAARSSSSPTASPSGSGGGSSSRWQLQPPADVAEHFKQLLLFMAVRNEDYGRMIDYRRNVAPRLPSASTSSNSSSSAAGKKKGAADDPKQPLPLPPPQQPPPPLTSNIQKSWSFAGRRSGGGADDDEPTGVGEQMHSEFTRYLDVNVKDFYAHAAQEVERWITDRDRLYEMRFRSMHVGGGAAEGETNAVGGGASAGGSHVALDSVLMKARSTVVTALRATFSEQRNKTKHEFITVFSAAVRSKLPSALSAPAMQLLQALEQCFAEETALTPGQLIAVVDSIPTEGLFLSDVVTIVFSLFGGLCVPESIWLTRLRTRVKFSLSSRKMIDLPNTMSHLAWVFTLNPAEAGATLLQWLSSAKLFEALERGAAAGEPSVTTPAQLLHYLASVGVGRLRQALLVSACPVATAAGGGSAPTSPTALRSGAASEVEAFSDIGSTAAAAAAALVPSSSSSKGGSWLGGGNGIASQVLELIGA